LNNRSVRAFSLGLVTGAVMASGVFVFAAPASADPVLDYADLAEGAICRTLSEFPTIYGVRGILEAIGDEGFTPYQAGEVVATAVIDACPQFIPVLERFVAMYGGEGDSTV